MVELIVVLVLLYLSGICFWFGFGFSRRRKHNKKRLEVDQIIDGLKQLNTTEISKLIDKLISTSGRTLNGLREEDRMRINKLREIRDEE
jgi:hypothetical protein